MIQGGSLRFRGPTLADVAEAGDRARSRRAGRAHAPKLVFQRPPGSTELELRVGLTWRGDEPSSRAALAPFRALPGMVEDGVRSLTWLQSQAPEREHPAGRAALLEGASRRLAAGGNRCTAGGRGRAGAGIDIVLVELIHGLPHRIPASSASFGGRAAVANVTALGVWFDPADDDAHVAWAREVASTAEPHSLTGAGYLNYAETDQTASRVAAAFGANFPRLQQIKRAVDPENLFRFNANIRPRRSAAPLAARKIFPPLMPFGRICR